MRRKPSPVGAMGMILGLALFGAVPADAMHGRDFVAMYRVENPTEIGDQVQVRLVVRAFNFSDMNLVGATITLMDSRVPGQAYGRFASFSMNDRESVRLDAVFTIPRAEYDLWEHAGSPRLQIDFLDEFSNLVGQIIEFNPLALGEGE